MAMKRYFAFPKAPALLEPHHQIVSCHIQDIRLGGCLTLLQGCSQCILQPQLTGQPFFLVTFTPKKIICPLHYQKKQNITTEEHWVFYDILKSLYSLSSYFPFLFIATQCKSIDYHMDRNKTECMCFEREGAISTLNGGPLKIVNKFTLQLIIVITSTTAMNRTHRKRKWSISTRWDSNSRYIFFCQGKISFTVPRRFLRFSLLVFCLTAYQ